MHDPKREMIKMAAKLFEEKGYHKCSIQDIVEPLGITKGSFYYYFKNKEELLYFIHDDMMNFLLEKTENLLKREELCTEDKLYYIVENVLQTIHEYRSNVYVFFQEMRYLSKENFEKIKKKRDYYNELVYKIITTEIEKGNLRKDLDPAMVMLGIFGMCNWAYQWYRRDGRLSVQEISRIFHQILIKGLIEQKVD